MSEFPLLPTPAPAPPNPGSPTESSPPARPSKRWDWRPKVQWFAAEIVVVVAGVLIALALNAWWQGRQDAAAEQVYLQQLQRDLLETERIGLIADSSTTEQFFKGVQFERAFFLPERPPADSVVAWFAGMMGIFPARPVLGTAEALISTGDLALIQNDSLRSAITAYLDRSRLYSRTREITENVVRENLFALSRLFNPVDLLRQGRTRAELDSLSQTPGWPLPAGDHRDPFAIDLEALLNNRAAHTYVSEMNGARGRLMRFQGAMLRDARALRAQVEAELAP